MKFQIKLPIPPSSNTLYYAVGSKMYKQQRTKEYVKLVADVWGSLPLTPIKKHYRMLIDVYGLPHRRDLANCEKVVSDALQKCKAIKNDCFCESVMLTKYPLPEGENEGYIIVTVWDSNYVEFVPTELDYIPPPKPKLPYGRKYVTQKYKAIRSFVERHCDDVLPNGKDWTIRSAAKYLSISVNTLRRVIRGIEHEQISNQITDPALSE